ncbi:putative ribonuclease H protein [Vitis vinifera]|uniref:Putative ribonuclease H protein n=2 Tax=Magnoliopsida TaxID=3398 RepID=A0A438GV35_VITVI|nr:putative ribonuclease H protein [Vitis vinifera]
MGLHCQMTGLQVATRGNGATTVSATMFFAAMVGIPVFVTGGIGGVHRHGENTMDISSDLTELGRTPVAVISAGVKSILDIPRTLEKLKEYVLLLIRLMNFQHFSQKKVAARILLWFEAASGLKINLEKSMVIPVGEVEGALDMAAEIGCKVGQLPTVYLGLPLGAPNRASSVWDGVEEKMRRKLALWKRQFLSKGGRITLIKSTLASIPLYQMSLFRMPKSVARRLEKLQRNFLWGGANGGNKVHLIKWEVVCTDKKKGGLGLRKLFWLNKALLGKWIWRFARAKEELWKKVLEAKYGKEEFGWRTRKANGVFGVGVWKEILKESTWCWDNMVFKVGKGNKVRFWIDPWCGNNVLSEAFPDLFSMAVQRNATVEDYWDQNLSQGGWSLRLLRDFNDWELGLVDNMLVELRNYRVSMEEDSVFWRGGADGLFKVKEAYRVLINADGAAFPIAMFGWPKFQQNYFLCLGSYLGEDTPEDCAQLIDANIKLKLGTGILIAVPIPKEHAASGSLIESAIQLTLKEARDKNIIGNAETPFLLARVNELTGGASLASNIALVKNNAAIGAKISVALAQLRESCNSGDAQSVS